MIRDKNALFHKIRGGLSEKGEANLPYFIL